MKKVTSEEWEKEATRIWGSNYCVRIGSPEANKIDGCWWLYSVTPDAQPVSPLSRGVIRNIAGSEHASDAQMLEAFAKFEQRPMFGQGMTRNEYMLARIAMSIGIGRTPGTDGPHDGEPDCTANREWEKEAQQAILSASLSVGGALVASDPTFHVGAYDELARQMSANAPQANYEGFFEHRELQFIQRALTLLEVSL